MLAMRGIRWALKRLRNDDHRRIVNVGPGMYWLGKDSVWYVGPNGQEKVSSDEIDVTWKWSGETDHGFLVKKL